MWRVAGFEPEHTGQAARDEEAEIAGPQRDSDAGDGDVPLFKNPTGVGGGNEREEHGRNGGEGFHGLLLIDFDPADQLICVGNGPGDDGDCHPPPCTAPTQDTIAGRVRQQGGNPAARRVVQARSEPTPGSLCQGTRLNSPLEKGSIYTDASRVREGRKRGLLV